MPSSTGETNLSTLLASLTATLHPTTFVFTTMPYSDAKESSLTIPLDLVEASIREPEGLTLITTATAVTQFKFPSIYPCRKITLNVHSSLEAVGFMAAITARLTAAGISVNPVSGYYHDHLFVPEGKAEETMRILEEIAEGAKGDMKKA